MAKMLLRLTITFGCIWLLAGCDGDDSGGKTPIKSLSFPDQALTACIEALDVVYVEEIKVLTCFGMTDASGISALTQLESLEIQHSSFSSAVDLSANKSLKSFVFTASTSVDIKLPKNGVLEDIYIDGGKIQQLILPQSLILDSVTLINSDLSELDFTEAANLSSLYIGQTSLSKLNISHNSKLKYLYLRKTILQEIDLSGNPVIESLTLLDSGVLNLDVTELVRLENLAFDAESGILIGLDGKEVLKVISLNNLSLRTLNLEDSDHLESVEVKNSNLEDITLPFHASLRVLDLRDNNLENLDSDRIETLKHLQLSGNPIDCDDVMQAHGLVTNLTVFDVMQHSECVDSGTTNETYLAAIEIPDPNLEKCVRSMSGVTVNTVGQISCEAYFALDVISSLDGLEYLVAVKDLYLDVKDIGYADFSALEKLERLSISDYGDEALNVVTSSNVSLKFLELKLSKAPVIDLSNNVGLNELSISVAGEMNYTLPESIQLRSLSVIANDSLIDFSKQEELEYLHLRGRNNNHIINFNNHPKIIELTIESYGLKEVDVRPLEYLENLNLFDNLIASVDLSENRKLQSLNIHKNEVSTLSLTNNGLLTNLDVGSNRLSGIDISSLSNLELLRIQNNNIDTINLSGALNLLTANLSDNPIAEIDISGNSRLESMSISGTDIPCEQRRIYQSQYPEVDISYTDNYCG